MLRYILALFSRRKSSDPFAHPFGDVAIVAERSPAEEGCGYSARELHGFKPSAQRAALADQGSGGDGNTSRAPSLPAYRGRERRAY